MNNQDKINVSFSERGDWVEQLQNRMMSSEDFYRIVSEKSEMKDLATPNWLEDRRKDFLALDDDYRFAITHYYFNLADISDPDDPILRQVLPDIRESEDAIFHEVDPLAEDLNSPLPGLIHRYPDRVLLLTTHQCAIYCRFCTRKRKIVRKQTERNPFPFNEILHYIRENTSIKEAILSGGDPLMLSDQKLDEILSSLKSVEHLLSIRIHTRIPVVLPDRITSALENILRKSYPVTIVVHFNHAREITPNSARAIRSLRLAGASVLNQSVLLKGVNDTVEELEKLNGELVRIGVIPYYLHQCDEIAGTSHFRTPLEKGRELLSQLRGRNPGISLPRFMIDLPGGGGKIPYETDYRVDSTINKIPSENGRALFHNWNGNTYSVLT